MTHTRPPPSLLRCLATSSRENSGRDPCLPAHQASQSQGCSRHLHMVCLLACTSSRRAGRTGVCTGEVGCERWRRGVVGCCQPWEEVWSAQRPCPGWDCPRCHLNGWEGQIRQARRAAMEAREQHSGCLGHPAPNGACDAFPLCKRGHLLTLLTFSCLALSRLAASIVSESQSSGQAYSHRCQPRLPGQR